MCIVRCSDSMKRAKLAGEQSSFDAHSPVKGKYFGLPRPSFRAKDNVRFENQLRVFTIKNAGGCYKSLRVIILGEHSAHIVVNFVYI